MIRNCQEPFNTNDENLKNIIKEYPFELSDFQKYSINAILSGHNSLVTASTGSGKTLTSFKTAQLASKLPDIDKVLFVVDRKDLDYQTMKDVFCNIKQFIEEVYNKKRLHSSIGYKPPIEYENEVLNIGIEA